MTPELWTLLCNQFLQVTLVALGVGLIVKLVAADRPHLAHCLWALVLLKCITPPVVASPTGVFTWLNQATRAHQDNTLSDQSELSDNEGNELSETLPELAAQRYYIPLQYGEELETRSVWDGASATAKASMQASYQFVASNRLFAVWLVGCCFAAAAMAWRLWRFLHLVKRLRTQDRKRNLQNRRLRLLNRALAKRLGIRRPVDVVILDSTIGPAIVGLFRPCILLPKVIVERASHADLKALLAHELVHFRRGDLWWSTLQAMALAVSWCNPLIWLVSRKFTQEAERCCDEETVAGLGLDPASYARCLISVLERKQTLRAAPLLPGVRPLDVTSKRLERIMRFGQGCRSRSPNWATLVLFVGAAALLPGAATTVAQEDGKSSKPLLGAPLAVASQTTEESVKFDFKAYINSNNLEQLGYKFDVFPAEQALAKLVEEGCDPQVALGKLQAMLPRGTHWTSAQSTTKHGLGIEFTDSETGKRIQLGGNKPAILAKENKVYALGTQTDLELVKATIDRVANHGVTQLKYEIRIIELPTTKAKMLVKDWQVVGEIAKKAEEGVVAASYTVDAAEVFQTRKSGALSECEIGKIEELIEAGADALAAPTIIGLNGMPVEMMMGGEVPFVSSFHPLEDEDGNKTETMQPVVGFAKTGMILKLTGALDKKTETVDLSLDYTQAELKGMDSFTFNSGNGELTVQQPVLEQNQVVTHEKMPLNETIAICGGTRAKETVTEQRIPILSKIPGVSRLFKSSSISREMVSTIILIECSQVQPGDRLEEVAETPLEATPVKSSPAAQEYRLEPAVYPSPRLLPPLPKAKFAPQASSKPQEESQSSVELQTKPAKSQRKTEKAKPRAAVQDEARHERYERHSVIGPITAGKNSKIRALSDDEVMQVLLDKSYFKVEEGMDYRIVKEKIADYVDPSRFIPLIGDASLHHQHYKCTVYDSTGKVAEVTYIDHNHFHTNNPAHTQDEPVASDDSGKRDAAKKDVTTVSEKSTKTVVELGGEVKSDLGVSGVLIVDEYELTGDDDEVFNFHMGLHR